MLTVPSVRFSPYRNMSQNIYMGGKIFSHIGSVYPDLVFLA